MFCPTCGQSNPDGAAACASCHAPMPGAPKKDATDGLQLLLPVKVNIWAFFAGYLGLFAILMIFAPFALIMGLIAVRQLRRHEGERGYGRAWFGIVMGVLGTLALVVLLVAAAH